jgi:hypothetical protein
MADEPKRLPEDAIRELVTLLRTGYKALLESRSVDDKESAKHVDSQDVRDPAA